MWIEKTTSHYNTRVSFHEASTKNCANLEESDSDIKDDRKTDIRPFRTGREKYNDPNKSGRRRSTNTYRWRTSRQNLEPVIRRSNRYVKELKTYGSVPHTGNFCG